MDVNVVFETDSEDRLASLSIHPAKAGSAAAAYWREEVDRIVAKPIIGLKLQGSGMPSRVDRAFLYWAFLTFTGSLGYAFATAPGSWVVARALLDTNSASFGRAARLQVPPIGQILRELEPSMPFLWSLSADPEHLSCLGWRFGDFLVLLPWPTDSGGGIYRQLDDLAASGATNFGSGKIAPIELIAKAYPPPR